MNDDNERAFPNSDEVLVTSISTDGDGGEATMFPINAKIGMMLSTDGPPIPQLVLEGHVGPAFLGHDEAKAASKGETTTYMISMENFGFVSGTIYGIATTFLSHASVDALGQFINELVGMDAENKAQPQIYEDIDANWDEIVEQASNAVADDIG